MNEEKKEEGLLLKALGIVIFIIFFYWGYNNFTLDFLKSKATLVQEAVTDLKQTIALPITLDEVTTLTNITENNGAIRYHYLISGLDTSTLNSFTLKTSLLPSSCNDSDIRYLLNKGINVEYAYTDNSTLNTFLVVITKSDCL